MKKIYLTPDFEVFEVSLIDVICSSPVEGYATQVVTTPPGSDEGEDGEPFDDGFN